MLKCFCLRICPFCVQLGWSHFNSSRSRSKGKGRSLGAPGSTSGFHPETAQDHAGEKDPEAPRTPQCRRRPLAGPRRPGIGLGSWGPLACPSPSPLSCCLGGAAWGGKSPAGSAPHRTDICPGKTAPPGAPGPGHPRGNAWLGSPGGVPPGGASRMFRKSSTLSPKALLIRECLLRGPQNGASCCGEGGRGDAQGTRTHARTPLALCSSGGQVPLSLSLVWRRGGRASTSPPLSPWPCGAREDLTLLISGFRAPWPKTLHFSCLFSLA